MTRAEKQAFVDQFSGMCANSTCMVVVRQVGLSAPLLSQLRRDGRALGVMFRVVKNRLAKQSLRGEFSSLADCLSGPVGIFFSDDPVTLAKFVEDFSKKREDKFYPISGMMEGVFLEKVEVKRLASLPTLDQLRAQIMGLILGPVQRILSVVQEPSRQVVRVLSAYTKKIG